MNGPSLALDESGNLHTVWSTAGTVKAPSLLEGKTEAPFKVLYRRFDARKGTWDEPVCLAGGRHPRIAVSPDGVPSITWVREGAVMLARLTENGRAAPLALKVSQGDSIGAYPSLALAPNGGILVAWQQLVGDDSTQVYVARIAPAAGKRISRDPRP
jgi:hypothetical protein